jgi:hypothetical protein
MNDDERTPGIHVRAGSMAVYVHPLNEDGTAPDPPVTVGIDPPTSGWLDVGFTDGVQVEEEEHEVHAWGDMKPQRTVFSQTASLEVGDVSIDTFRRLLGIAPVQRHHSLTYGWVDHHNPPPAPTKRKGLTGKAYRIARRRHARLVKRLRRLEPTSYLTHVPRVKVDPDNSDFEGHSIRFSVLDEVSDFVLPDLRDRSVE